MATAAATMAMTTMATARTTKMVMATAIAAVFLPHRQQSTKRGSGRNGGDNSNGNSDGNSNNGNDGKDNNNGKDNNGSNSNGGGGSVPA